MKTVVGSTALKPHMHTVSRPTVVKPRSCVWETKVCRKLVALAGGKPKSVKVMCEFAIRDDKML